MLELANTCLSCQLIAMGWFRKDSEATVRLGRENGWIQKDWMRPWEKEVVGVLAASDWVISPMNQLI